jgi:hypothetical protein
MLGEAEAETSPASHAGRRWFRRDPTAPTLLGLPVAWLVVFFVVPIGIVAAYSVDALSLANGPHPVTLTAWRQLVTGDPFLGHVYLALFWKSVKMSLIVSAVIVALAYPLAYYLALSGTKRKYVLLLLLIAPFLTSYLLRVLAWKVLLGDQGPQAEDPWIKRTFTASRLVHELDGGVPQPILDILDDPGLTVYRYWDDRPLPVTTGNPDVPTVVYSVPGKEAVAVVVSYSTSDENIALSVDAKTLGFSGSYQAVDTESGEKFAPASGKIAFPLKKHDMKIIRFTAAQ